MSENAYKILIVDDSEKDRALYKTYLNDNRSDFYTFYEAQIAKDGLTLFNTVNPDCIILDYRLPDQNGIEFLKMLSQKRSILPVLMLTGYGSEELAAECIKCGAQNYISKNNMNPNSLCKAVSDTIDQAMLLRRVANQNEILKAQKERAEKADKAKSDFLATMSHEIRTPLNGIIGMAELLNFTALNDKQKQYLDSISSSGELLLTIINDILDFSKIEALELELEETDINLKNLLTEALQLLSSRANENRVELILRWPRENNLPVFKADPVRLRQILLNLIGNAVKFTKDGYVTIDVSFEEQEDTLLNLKIEIEDTGIGIPKNKIDDIFVKFSQVDSSITREYGGTGLGLTICKRLIEMMGGSIHVESVEGKGSKFWFNIPVTKVLESISATKEYWAFKDILIDKRILIVDDYALNLDLFSEYLGITGAQIEVAPDAMQAKEKITIAQKTGNPFDLILIDYAMPKMDGETLGKTLTDMPEQYGRPKKILITALGKKKNSNTYEKAGFYTTLFKPVYPSDFVRTISDCIHDIKTEDNSILDNNSRQYHSLPNIGSHVLIVDDDRVSSRITKNILEELGCSHEIAVNGQEAIDILKKRYQRFDIVFMDWQMPIMDGEAATKALRSKAWGKNIKIVALTANAISGDKERCIKAGANDYLSKPVRVSDVMRLLE